MSNRVLGSRVLLMGALAGLLGPGSPLVMAGPLNDSSPIHEAVKLISPAKSVGQEFGARISVSGDYAIVGAAGNGSSAAAYVFGRHQGGSNNWGLVASLAALPGEDFFGNFGRRVSISGDTAIVGVSREGEGGPDLVSVFQQDEGGVDNWGLVTTIPVIGLINDGPLEIDGDTLVIGSTQGSKVVVYGRNVGGLDNWGEVAQLTAGGGFGYSASISGDVMIVGAPFDNSGGNQSGSAYLFSRDEGGVDNWGQVKKLTGSTVAVGDKFGLSVAASGETVLVGCPGHHSAEFELGAGYLFSRNEGGADNWGEIRELTPTPTVPGDWFYGHYVAMDGEMAILGTDGLVPSGESGSAVIFRRDEGGSENWGELANLTASDGLNLDLFGTVAIDDRTVFVGARLASGVFSMSGACYVFLICSASQEEVEILDASGDEVGGLLGDPRGIVTGPSGNLYVAGSSSDTVFKIESPDSAPVTTLIGDAAGDGIGNAMLEPVHLAVDSAENVYVSCAVSDNVFQITPAGVVTEVLDSTGDGLGNGFNFGGGLAVDSAGTLYVVGQSSDNVFKIVDPGGSNVVSQILDASGDGLGNNLSGPRTIAVDGGGNVFVSGLISDNVFKVEPGGLVIEALDATGDGGGNSLNGPIGTCLDDSGNLYVAGAVSDNVFKVTPGGTVSELADGFDPRRLMADALGNIYTTDLVEDRVLRISPSGMVEELLGASGDGFGNDLDQPIGVAVSASGDVYAAGQGSDNVFLIPGAEPGFPYCFGSECPCGMDSLTCAGCQSTSTAGATLTASGLANYSADSFRLSVSGIPPGKPGLCVKGSNRLSLGGGNPVGDGLLCTSPQLRSQVIVASPSGTVSMEKWRGLAFGTYPGTANVGSLTYYQWWYRDPSPSCSGQGFNFSNGWCVDWQ